MSVEEFPEKGRPLFLNNLAYAYGALGINLDDAVEIADRAFGMRHDPRIAGTLAGLMNRIHQPDAALQWADYALKHLPRREGNSRAYGLYCRAVALGTLGRITEARQAALKARGLARLPEVGDRIHSWLEEHGGPDKTGS
jgi:tetratricopeptide (TPR) repeat protein